VDEIPPLTRSIEMHLGTSVHSALEKLYLEAKSGNVLSSDEIMVVFGQKWEEGYTAEMRIVRFGTTAKTYLEMGRQMLLAYYQKFHPFTQSATVALEESFLFPVSDDHGIRGVVDRIARTEAGALEIHDYKTSRRHPTVSQIRADTQLALYELAMRHRWPEASRIYLIWHYLSSGCEIRITKTPEQLAAVKHATLGLIETIQAAGEFPANVSRLCDWCGYKEICPAIKSPQQRPQ